MARDSELALVQVLRTTNAPYLGELAIAGRSVTIQPDANQGI
jgi:hypothetical protein